MNLPLMQTYRLSPRGYGLACDPDARLGDVSFDWTLTEKTISDPQIRGFFRADSQPRAVIIIRPSQFGQGSSYLIPRPAYIAL